MSNGPIEPNANMRAMAASFFQMFTALVQEGFSERQAIGIIGQVLEVSMLDGDDEDKDK